MKFAKRQEAVRKDTERCFGVLSGKYKILEKPMQGWFLDDIKNVVLTCIILHNMTVKNQCTNYSFSDTRETMDGENDIEDTCINGEPIGTIFMNKGGVDKEVANLLAARVAHMSYSVEDQQQYTNL